MAKEKKAKDLFKNCFSPGWIIVLILLIILSFIEGNIKEIGYVLFFVILGVLCLYNYSSCGRIHCRITGWGFLILGALGLLNLLSVISINFNILWMAFLVIVLISFIIEFIYKSKTGNCYFKNGKKIKNK